MILPNAFLVAEKNTSVNSITSFIVKQDRKLAQSIQHICDIQTNASSVILKEPIFYKAEWHKWILMSLIECPPAFKPVGILLFVPYYRQLLYPAANRFAFKCKDHIWSAFKETNITFPACPALTMKQPDELLLHLAPAVRTDTLACAHICITGASQGFLQQSYHWLTVSSTHPLLRPSWLLLLPLLQQ